MNDTLTPSDISAAEDSLLRDVDTLQDWIGGECQYQKVRIWLPHWTDFDATTMNAPSLLAMAFDRGQKHATRIAALNELADRYLKANNDAVIAKAGEYADEREEEDRREAWMERAMEDAA